MRIIPAGAGKRDYRSGYSRCNKDHPRGCGEEPPASRSSRRVAGSSPRVRGRVAQIPSSMFPFRIIPAGAGKSPSSIVRRR